MDSLGQRHPKEAPGAKDFLKRVASAANEIVGVSWERGCGRFRQLGGARLSWLSLGVQCVF
jgi:hypothetical protein